MTTDRAFLPTHLIHTTDSLGTHRTIPVCNPDFPQPGPLYTQIEWDMDGAADWTLEADGTIRFQGAWAPPGIHAVRVESLEDIPHSLREAALQGKSAAITQFARVPEGVLIHLAGGQVAGWGTWYLSLARQGGLRVYRIADGLGTLAVKALAPLVSAFLLDQHDPALSWLSARLEVVRDLPHAPRAEGWICVSNGRASMWSPVS